MTVKWCSFVLIRVCGCFAPPQETLGTFYMSVLRGHCFIKYLNWRLEKRLSANMNSLKQFSWPSIWLFRCEYSPRSFSFRRRICFNYDDWLLAHSCYTHSRAVWWCLMALDKSQGCKLSCHSVKELIFFNPSFPFRWPLTCARTQIHRNPERFTHTHAHAQTPAPSLSLLGLSPLTHTHGPIARTGYIFSFHLSNTWHHTQTAREVNPSHRRAVSPYLAFRWN